MSKSIETSYFNQSFKLPNNGLRSYFGNVVKGKDVELRTSFGGKETPLTTILNDWERILEQIEHEWPSLWEYEKDLRAKVGPLSIMKPLKDRMNDIENYYTDILNPSEPILDEAIKATLSEFKQIKGLRVRSVQRTTDSMKLSKNSGSPFFTRKSNVLAETVPFTLEITGDGVIQHLGGRDYNALAILGWRGQEGGIEPDDVKQRVVWMFPFTVNIAELQVYQPLIEACQQFNLIPAWVSMESVDLSITKLFDTKGKDDIVVCSDFSRFDQHFNSSLQDATLRILTMMFKGDSTFEKWTSDIFPIKYMIPMAYNWERVKFGKHGMGSGSGGTNADETLAHRALQYECAILNSSKLNTYSMCLGDDGVLSYPGITVDQVVEAYSRHGQEMNKDKQYASTEDCVYLRRWHHRNYRVDNVCVGVYSTFRALGRLCERERTYEMWSKEMEALRQLSILENVKYHPMREQFIDFCMERDSERLGLDIPGFLNNITKIAEESIEYMPDFRGYSQSVNQDPAAGIANWWVVNYLKSKQ